MNRLIGFAKDVLVLFTLLFCMAVLGFGICYLLVWIIELFVQLGRV
jgi:hypothetical protein